MGYGDKPMFKTSRFDWPAIGREYRDGATLKELAAKYGVSYEIVRDRLKSYGVPMRPSCTGNTSKPLPKPRGL